MATTSEARALPFFTDLQGQPLASGYIYIGQAGLDPVAYPAVITSDLGGTTVVAQPVRTTNGHAAASGALIHLFVPIPYSITILDSARRVVYTSLNETDPVAVAIGSSSVQSASSLADLRSRSGASTNQVWVDGFGMYVYNSTDTTSPENIPFVIVGGDGSRYYLSQFGANLGFAKVSGLSATPNSQGLWVSWNEDHTNGYTYLTNNNGGAIGGFIFRNMALDGTTVEGTVGFSGTGAISASGDIRASGNLIAEGGIVAVTADGTRALQWDAVNSRYSMPGAPLQVNGSAVITEAMIAAELVNIFQNRLVGCTLIGTTAPTPGTWVTLVSGVGSTGVNQYLRTA